VLVVDDEELYRRALERILARVGHQVSTARDAAEALALVSSQPIDLVLCDVKMPGINGLELVRQVHELEPDLPCIVITGYGSAEHSVEALRAGAFWYLEKPFDQGNLDVVRRLVEQAIEHGRLKAENRLLQSQLRSLYRFENIVGTSTALRRVLETVEKVADSDSTVLITGESGTGKSLVARAIHRHSARRDKPFVEVACGALPETLLESELFGHVAGAFTGAAGNKLGKFMQADGGTIFLDEISTASPGMQVKLLRVLQDFEFEQVGGTQTFTIDTRVILASNEDLARAVTDGRFRQDLFYRINVINIELPALRERISDIPLLAEHFLTEVREDCGKNVHGFSDDAVAALQRYPWPGNVRELQNVIERAVLLGKSDLIRLEDLPAALAAAAPVSLEPIGGRTLKQALEAPERQIIREVLEANNWNRHVTAEALGINRTTLYKKMKRLGLEEPYPALAR